MDNEKLDRVVDDLLGKRGHAWPLTDEQLDAWLAEHPLSAGERDWVTDVVRRRMNAATSVPASSPPPAAPPALTETRKRPRPLRADELARLDRELHELVEAKVPLPVGLARCEAELREGPVGEVVAGLRADLEAGLPLSQALAQRGKLLPPVYAELVKAGEASGDVASVLLLLAEQAERDADVTQKTRDILVYPTVTFALGAAGLAAIFLFLGPLWSRIYGSMNLELPWITELFLFGAHVTEGFPVAGGVILTLIAGAIAATAVWKLGPKIGRRVLERGLPGERLAQISRVLSGFLARGVAANTAFRAIAAAYGKAFPAGDLDGVADRLETGSTIAQSLRGVPGFPHGFVWLVSAAEERGSLPETLIDIAERHERAFARRVRLLETLVGPAVLATIGLVVGSGIVATLWPIFRLQQSLMQ